MANKNKVWNLKIYTKTVLENRKPTWYGVIEAPLNKMLKAFPDEFSFVKHETRRSLDAARLIRSKTKTVPKNG